MEFKKATVFVNYAYDLPVDKQIFKRAKNQRLSAFIKSVRRYAFRQIAIAEEELFALIVYEGDVGKTYEKITKDDVLKARDFDSAKFKQLRAYRHETRETED